MSTLRSIARLVPRSLRAPLRRELVRAGLIEPPPPPPAPPAPVEPPLPTDSTGYWTSYNVTRHQRFATAEASLDAFDWRSQQYFGYLELMPVAGHDGRAVLDYGCGPGHDLVGFSTFSRPSRLVGADVSSTSLAEARDRLALHQTPVELVQLGGQREPLPFPDASFDYIASSGVLHHVEDPVFTLSELRRVLRPGGELRVMIYNYDSVYLHLYVAYAMRIEEGRYADLELADAFRRLTDGPQCPISRAYTPAAWLDVARQAGLTGRHLGNAVSAEELHLLPKRFRAIQSPALAREHRHFLRELSFDARGIPLHDGQVAGIDAVFSLQRA